MLSLLYASAAYISARGIKQSGCPHASVRSVSVCEPFLPLYLLNDFNKTDRNEHQFHVTPMTLKRLPGQRSRSASDGHRNLVNAIAPGQMKGYEPKLAQLFPVVGTD